MIRKFNVKVNGKSYEVEVEELGTENTPIEKPEPQVVYQPKNIPTSNPTPAPVKSEPKPKPKTAPAPVSSGKNTVKAPLPGVIVDLFVSEGARVEKGQKLLVIEAMKMENEILSDYDGVIEKILVKKGDNVDGDQDLIIIS